MIRSSIFMCLCLCLSLISVQSIQGSFLSKETGFEVGGDKEVDPEECFQYGLDITGSYVNNGYDDKVNSPAECLAICQSYPGAKYFIWFSGVVLSSNARLSCWCNLDNEGTAPFPDVVSGPLECEGSVGACCDSLEFTSSGWISSHESAHVLGSFEKVSVGDNGRNIFQQQGGSRHYLSYSDSLQMWLIGNEVGSDTGYAATPGTDVCPERIVAAWDAYSSDDDSWIMDATAKMNCV